MKIFIAGGTSGIGYALAEFYLSVGSEVAICGRDLSKVPTNGNRNLKIFEADVRDYQALESALRNFTNDNLGLDIFINCAGSYAEDVAATISYEEADEMLKTNIVGCVNCFEVAKSHMINYKNGKIAVIASVSGIMDYENSSLYTKTKRSVIQIADAYRRALQPYGISITTIAPGYVDTQKLRALNNDDLSKKPFIVDLETATKIIVDSIEKKEKLVIFPFKMKILMKSLALLPSFILNRIMFKKAKWMKND